MTRADVWLAQDSPDPEILVVGVPWAVDSRADLAPGALRERLHRFSTSAEEWGVDLSSLRVRDEGNWAVSEMGEPEMAVMVQDLAGALPAGPLRLYLGGDSAITSVAGNTEDANVIRFARNADPLATVDEQLFAGAGANHVSVDLAVLDRVYAPGARGARPGGLHISPLADAVRRSARHPSMVSFDFVGVDPELDSDGLTLDAMAHLLLSAVAGKRERDAV